MHLLYPFNATLLWELNLLLKKFAGDEIAKHIQEKILLNKLLEKVSCHVK